MAYDAVISLKHTIHRFRNPNNIHRHRFRNPINITDPIDIPQFLKAAYEECDSLRSMLKKLDDSSSRSIDRSVINELDAQIRDAVWELEDVLEPFVLWYNSLLEDEDEDEDQDQDSFVLEEGEEFGNEIEIKIDSFLKKVKNLREEFNRELLQKPLPAEEDETTVPPVHESTTIGLADLSQKIINQLLSDWKFEFLDLKSHRLVSVVGMAGIGKTHLAALIYHHPRIVQHFDARAWVKVGPKDKLNNLCLDILAQIEGKPRDLFKDKSEPTLREILRNSLPTRRYLIVLDDIWTTQTLEYLAEFLPVNENRGQLLLTTRLQEVAPFYIKTPIYQMPFLNNEESWNLLWQNVFVAEKSFPPQLEKPGRKIAENCEGLPLLILAVSSILRGLDKTEECWKMVAEKKTTTFTDAYEQIYEVLLPSYEYLPQQLKACFLYMGVFPQSCEIPVSKLIYFWNIEDFLESNLLQNFEDFAVIYVVAVASKSLAIVCKKRFHGHRLKSLKLHSAYWYLCVKVARKTNFFHVLNKLTDVVSIERPRRFSVQNNILLGLKEVCESMNAAISSTIRSLLCTGEDHQYPVRVCFGLMLLMRVLDALAIRFYEFPNEVLKLLQLRYLSLTHNGELPSSISKLKQLQCLILRRHHNIIKLVQRDSICLPEEIWDMEELRHLRIMGSNLPDPSGGAELWNLLTLYVNTDSCTGAVFRSIPNVKKLGITIGLEPAAESVRCFEHIKFLYGLESLKCDVVNPRLRSELAVASPDHLSNLPRGLTKFCLNGLGYSWKYMSVIGSLPNLKVLKLRCSAFQGPEWETEVGLFKNLEYLLLEDIDLVHWTTQPSKWYKWETSFPLLRHLIIRHCYKLKTIPPQIGVIPHLEMMEVDDCSPLVMASAQQIKENSISSDLELVINSSWK